MDLKQSPVGLQCGKSDLKWRLPSFPSCICSAISPLPAIEGDHQKYSYGERGLFFNFMPPTKYMRLKKKPPQNVITQRKYAYHSSVFIPRARQGNWLILKSCSMRKEKKKMSPPSLIFGGINNAGRRKANSAAFSSKLTALAICVLLDSAAPFGPPICKCGKAAESCDLRNKHGGGWKFTRACRDMSSDNNVCLDEAACGSLPEH